MRKLLVTACLCLATAGFFTQLSAASFTRSSVVPSNVITVDALRNYFSVTPGSDVRPGTSTAVAAGNVDGLAIDLGTVPSARTFSNVFRITNIMWRDPNCETDSLVGPSTHVGGFRVQRQRLRDAGCGRVDNTDGHDFHDR